MRTILVVNSKGGCGKTTIATNLATHYALLGRRVVLADYDPQGSSLAWLAARGKRAPAIAGINAVKDIVRPDKDTELLILDAPAGVRGSDLTGLVRRAQTILIPVLPGPTDMRAAARFVHQLLLLGRIERKETRLATVANRVPEATLPQAVFERTLPDVGFDYVSTATRVYQPLARFLERLRIPFVAKLRDSLAYPVADDAGLSIFELNEAGAARDRLYWRPLIDWLESRRSLPRET
jgi:chromosome partitioning protein